MMATASQPRLDDGIDERDSCGIGLIADLGARRSHRILRYALEAIAHLDHRGAINADGRTGDGAGILTQLPQLVLRRALGAAGVAYPADAPLAVGVLFLPVDRAGDDARDAARRAVDTTLRAGGLEPLLWRPVPCAPAVLGAAARATLPRIEQVLIGSRDLRDDALERRLYLVRRRIAEHLGDRAYLPSLSARTVVYKGFMLASDLAAFYPDLRDPAYETAMALFHQRYSTNTTPTWHLAQPFRLLAHNGEINTLDGNRNWMRAREAALSSGPWGDDLRDLRPLIEAGGSDSAMLDNALEFYVRAGYDPLRAMAMLVPEAYEGDADVSDALAAFYDLHATLSEPWDGPAALVFSDGRIAGATLDRNGLRPQRYWIADDVLIVGSETGLIDLPPSSVIEKGRLGPGMMLAVDLERGGLLHNDAIKQRLAAARPYAEWRRDRLHHLSQLVQVKRPHQTTPRARWAPHAPVGEVDAADALRRQQLAHGYGTEDLEWLVRPMAQRGKPPVGSMGDDTPIAAFSHQPQLLYRSFKQRFAQVTNPPIDPLRERRVQSISTLIGAWADVHDPDATLGHAIVTPTPVLDPIAYDVLFALEDEGYPAARLDARVALESESLAEAIARLCRDAARVVADGARIVVLSDRDADAAHAPVPMLLAVSAVHHHLVAQRLRTRCSLICDAGDVREDHHLACLIGYGATAVHPHLAYRSAAADALRQPVQNDDADARDSDPAARVAAACGNVRRALEEGLRKIMAKLGVCPLTSYHGAQLFEAIGLDDALVGDYFPGTPSRIGGVTLDRVEADLRAFHALAAFDHAATDDASADLDGAPALPDRGQYRYRRKGEAHAHRPQVFKALHKAVRSGDREAFARYAAAADEGPVIHLRDLLTWRRAAQPLPLDAVEPAEAIVPRFLTSPMSFGALSPETHEALAVGMNRIGGRSSSGEGGEDERRFRPYDAPPVAHADKRWTPKTGDWGNSVVKQVASGRFGVTPHYLMAAQELEIKMAQGSKPGEGGQIPGHKVTAEIARLRRSVPGVGLISPPPHHDIYSIEDLAQLIYDLKRINPGARVAVKLVALHGVGTIAAGVAKAHADTVHISGNDGGTGASPLGSIKHAGLPWELGLVEAQQTLVRLGLRGRVRLRIDGGLQTGRDVVLAALLGADEFGFGTSALVALGCVMARKCHLNTCPVGIATQRDDLRARFPGTPGHLIAYMLFLAEQVRHILADLGLARLDDAIGAVDRLRVRDDAAIGDDDPYAARVGRGTRIDLARLLADPDPTGTQPRRAVAARNDPPRRDGTIAADDQLMAHYRDAAQRDAAQRDAAQRDAAQRGADGDASVHIALAVRNRDRTVGARLAGMRA
ncbi:MAG: glutamate synthase large subunit, partial [Acidobacteriota bacterium]